MNITMKKIKAIDLIISSISLAIVCIAFLYIDSLKLKVFVLVLNLIIATIFLYLAIFKDTEENDNIIKSWDLYGKTALVIGKDRKNQYNDVTLVDINLNDCTYATLIDVEHAVLNYSNGCWYIEDLYSKNGINIQKKMENKKYKLSPAEPYKLEKGDTIYLGLTKLQVD